MYSVKEPINVIYSYEFLSLQHRTQCLYFHMYLRANDDGVCDDVYVLTSALGCDTTDLEDLERNGFIDLVTH